MKRLYLLVDPLINIHGSATPAILLGKRLKNVEIVSPIVDKNIDMYLNLQGLTVNNLNKRYRFNGSMLTFEGWLKNVEFKDGNDGIIINFSQCFVSNAHIYYAPGPIISALDDIYQEFSKRYKIFYKLTRSFLLSRDKEFNRRLRNNTQLFIAVSKYCASLYKRWGIYIEDVIYPPIDLSIFKPSTSSPSEDYVLTYLGKESKYSILHKIAMKGVKIKGFGSKTPFIPSYILNNSNIEILGEVSNEELIQLYSNALYTLFPFTHEPFGYVPIESIACSTPVLTYNKQGPSESILDDKNGWLVNSDDEIIEKAVELWKNGYDKSIRDNCRNRANDFSIDVIIDKWKEVLNRFN